MNLVNIVGVLFLMTVGNVCAKLSDYGCIAKTNGSTYNDITLRGCKNAELSVEWLNPYSMVMELFTNINETTQFKIQVEDCVLSFQSQPGENSTWKWKLDSYAQLFEHDFKLKVSNTNQLVDKDTLVNVGCRGQKTRSDEGDGKLWTTVVFDASETVGDVVLNLRARNLSESSHSKQPIEESGSENRVKSIHWLFMILVITVIVF